MERADINFDQSLGRLEEIVRLLEKGELNLNDSVAVFEEGVSLVKECNMALAKAEQKVLMVKKDLDSQPVFVEFQGE